MSDEVLELLQIIDREAIMAARDYFAGRMVAYQMHRAAIQEANYRLHRLLKAETK